MKSRGKQLIVILVSFCMIISIIHPYIILASNATEQDSVKVDSYIQSAVIEYQSGDEWIKVTDQTKNIPADARLKMKINYDDVEAKTLWDNNGTLSYQVPDLFKDCAVMNTTIQDADRNKIGTITVTQDGKTVKLKFEDSFLYHDEDEHKKINGNFTLYFNADKDKIKENPNQNVTVGNTTIHLNFEEDIDARLGELNISKGTPKFTEENGKGYLTYTLTVSTGDDSMPDVKISDYFTQNEKYVESYLGVSGVQTATAHKANSSNIPYESGDNADSYQSSVYIGNSSSDKSKVPEPAGNTVSGVGTLVWNVGNMKAHEVRKLTYKVKVQDSYIGIQSLGSITNNAKAFSKSYEHKEASSNFTPKAGMTISKTAGSYEADPSGNGGMITYRVRIKANENNSYTLNNVKLYDNFTQNGTNAKFFPYMQYDKNSFKVYEGYHEDEGKRLTIGPNKKNPDRSNPDIVTNNKNVFKFDIYLGEMKPGEERLVTYKVKVSEKIFTVNNGDVVLKNRGGLYSDDRPKEGNKNFGISNASKNIGKKIWDRKLQSEPMTNSQTIQIPNNDSIYNSSMEPISPSSRSFTIPSGSYKYQVVVNESGDWDVSSAVFGDALINDYLAYDGYLKIDYYEDGLATQPDTDEEAVKQLQNKIPAQTVWIDIHEGKNFSLSPESFQHEGKKGAYLLTYYATPKNVSDVTQVVSGNSFTVSGNVIGPGGTIMELSGVKVVTSVIIEGGNTFEASKEGWYFDAPKTTSGDWQYGSLYWVLEVSGNEIPAGTVFRDTPDRTNTWNRHFVKADSMQGVYVGKVPEGKSFCEYYRTVNDLSDVTELRKLSGNDRSDGALPSDADYQWRTDSLNADITLKKAVRLQKDEHLYIVLKTAPNRNITTRDVVRYDNELLTKDSGATDYMSQQKVSLWSAGGGNNFKEVMGVYERDSSGKWTTKQSISGNTYQKVVQSQVKESGIYIDWRIKINYIGNTSGKVIVEDQLPEGLDLTYVRYYWIHPDLRKNPPVTTTIPECEQGPWEKRELNAVLDGTNTTYKCIAYYNPKTRQIRMAIDNLQRGGDTDRKSLELQVLTKVTDTSVLLDGKQKDFVNMITVRSESGKTISTSTATASVQKTTVTKTKQIVKDGKLPFMITVNELGDDLLKDGNQITLVDEMKKPLSFDTDSVKVKDKDGNVLTGISPKIETTSTGEKMSLNIPDNQKLTITYDAILNAAPDTDISVSNKAYWLGHNSNIAEIENQTVRYHVESFAGSTTEPGLKVKKVDKSNTSTVLKGAEFIVQEVTYDSLKKEWVAAQNATIHKNTTDDNGIAIFGKTDELKYNTVYCVRETKAPSGYILDSTPHYFAIAKKTGNNGGEETYPAQLKQWETQGVNVYYLGSTYQYTMYNSRGTVDVDKQFIDVKGNPIKGKEIPDATCSFAIYENKGKNVDYTKEQKLEVLEITSKDGRFSYKINGVPTDKPQFSDLIVGGSFYIFELDQDGKPITQSGASYYPSDLIAFEVNYESEWKAYTINNQGTADTAKITNRYYTQLDPTGNTGVWNEHRWIYMCMTAAGIIAVAVAIYLIGIRRRY